MTQNVKNPYAYINSDVIANLNLLNILYISKAPNCVNGAYRSLHLILRSNKPKSFHYKQLIRHLITFGSTFWIGTSLYQMERLLLKEWSIPRHIHKRRWYKVHIQLDL